MKLATSTQVVGRPQWAGEKHPEPLPLTRELPPASSFPVESLGAVGSAVVDRMHQVIQAPQALIGQSILAAMNQVVQPYGNVVIDGRVSPLSEYFLTLGESGERKSAADSWALAGVRNRQRDLMQQHANDRDHFEQANDVYEATSKRILADRKLSPAAKQAKLAELEKPTAPVMPLLIVSEPSSEAIQRQFIIGLPSIGLVNDEGGQFLGGYAMSAEKRLGTLTMLSRLWDRGEFDRVRVGDGSGSYYGRRLSLHLMVQPAVASSLLADPLAREQGFLARCLISYPESTAGTRSYVETDLSQTQEYHTYASRVNELLSNEWPLVNDHELDPPQIYLTPPAKRAWVAIYNDLESALGKDGHYNAVRSLASKASEHISRLAGTFAIFDGDNVIHEEQVDRALRLILHYLDEAMRLWGAGTVKTELKLAQELLEWLRIKVGVGCVFMLADVYRKGPTQIRSAATARVVIRILIDHGWVVAATHPTAKEAFELAAF